MKKGFISAGITLEANTFSSRIECNVPSQISIKFLQISTSSEHRSQLSLLKMFFSSLPYLPNFPLILSDSISTASCLSIKKKKILFCILNRIKTAIISLLLDFTVITVECISLPASIKQTNRHWFRGKKSFILEN